MKLTHTKFRICEAFAEFIKTTDLSASASKLFFTLIFLQDQKEESWPSVLHSEVASKKQFVLVKDLREIGFPRNTRSSRFLRKPVAELNALQGVFQELKIAESGRHLTWKFTYQFFELMTWMDKYGLLDIDEVQLCRRKLDGVLLAQFVLNRKKRLPQFSLIALKEGYRTSAKLTVQKIIPCEVKRQIAPILNYWTNAHGITFVVLFVQDGEQPGYTDVVVRMRHKKTKWPEGRITKRPPGAMLWLVEPDLGVESNLDFGGLDW